MISGFGNIFRFKVGKGGFYKGTRGARATHGVGPGNDYAWEEIDHFLGTADFVSSHYLPLITVFRYQFFCIPFCPFLSEFGRPLCRGCPRYVKEAITRA
jgi:hypothetical protein